MNIFKKGLILLGILAVSAIQSFAAEVHTMSAEYTIPVPNYMHIKPVTSPVLTAHITNRTGNLYCEGSKWNRVRWPSKSRPGKGLRTYRRPSGRTGPSPLSRLLRRPGSRGAGD